MRRNVWEFARPGCHANADMVGRNTPGGSSSRRWPCWRTGRAAKRASSPAAWTHPRQIPFHPGPKRRRVRQTSPTSRRPTWRILLRRASKGCRDIDMLEEKQTVIRPEPEGRPVVDPPGAVSSVQFGFQSVHPMSMSLWGRASSSFATVWKVGVLPVKVKGPSLMVT